ncbi:hypothetical protein M426DRAFT_133322 [Hypoxylon sp. CI-4A]|nr:hypothetical protein M426DRAFT_133322 [Hypoxylon sp. CI-4A]
MLHELTRRMVDLNFLEMIIDCFFYFIFHFMLRTTRHSSNAEVPPITSPRRVMFIMTEAAFCFTLFITSIGPVENGRLVAHLFSY